MRQDIATPTPERLAKDDWLTIKTEQAGVTTVQVKTPHALEMYHSRNQLGQGDAGRLRYDAGCQIRDSYELAGLHQKVIGAYSEMVSRGSVQIQHVRLGAYEAWIRAMRAVGPVATDEVYDVCCLGETLKGRERLEILRRGLDVLAAHYGLVVLPERWY
jgi:hypothetical protein